MTEESIPYTVSFPTSNKPGNVDLCCSLLRERRRKTFCTVLFHNEKVKELQQLLAREREALRQAIHHYESIDKTLALHDGRTCKVEVVERPKPVRKSREESMKEKIKMLLASKSESEKLDLITKLLAELGKKEEKHEEKDI